MFYKVVSSSLYVAAVAAVLYCQEAIFKLNFIIIAVFALIAMHQLLAPKEKVQPKDEPADIMDDLKTSYDRIKTVKGFVPK